MNNIRENILNSYCFELEVTDAWQLPAVYKIYKENSNVAVNELCFFNELTNEEYLKFIEKVLDYKVDVWENSYDLPVGKVAEEEFSWKLTIYFGEGKKVIKRGKCAAPNEFADLEAYLIEITE